MLDHEKRALSEMAGRLAAEDPRWAATFTRGQRRFPRLHTAFLVLCVVLAALCLVLGEVAAAFAVAAVIAGVLLWRKKWRLSTG